MAFELFPDPAKELVTPLAEANEGGAVVQPSAARLCALPARPSEEVVNARIALARAVRSESVAALNQLLADSMTLRDLYKKHCWQASGATFYQLHELFDKHHAEQMVLIDRIFERVQILGGEAIAMAADIAVTTLLSLPPVGREAPLRQLARLSDAHEQILSVARAAGQRAAELGDDGTNGLLTGEVIRTNERQAWVVLQLSTSSPM
jgi:starvation-inducible DNA-binding protein